MLTSCFVPDQYEAEIRLTKDGSYGITFIGILISAPLYGQIVRGNIDGAGLHDLRLAAAQFHRSGGPAHGRSGLRRCGRRQCRAGCAVQIDFIGSYRAAGCTARPRPHH